MPNPKHLKKKTSLSTVLFTIFLSFFLALPLYAEVTKDPLDTLKIAQKGIDQSDYDLFSSVIDVESLLTSTVSNGAKELQQALQGEAAASSDLTLSLILAALGSGNENISAFQGLFINEGKSFLKAAVQGGYLAGNPDKSKVGNAGLFAKGLKGLGRSRKVIQPGKILSEKDDEARVSATYKDEKAGDFPLELLLRKNGDRWQISELTNIKEIIKLATEGMHE